MGKHVTVIKLLYLDSVQCRKDISELCMYVLYAHILHFRICQNVHICTCKYINYVCICLFGMHSDKFLCRMQCWPNEDISESENGFKVKFVYSVKMSCRSMKAIILQVFDDTSQIH